MGKRWVAEFLSALKEAYKVFFLTPHLQETTKNNRGNLSPINFQCQEEFSKCSLAKKKPSAYEVEEEKEEKVERKGDEKICRKKSCQDTLNVKSTSTRFFFAKIKMKKKEPVDLLSPPREAFKGVFFLATM